MQIADIFAKRKKEWDSITRMRRQAEGITRNCPKCQEVISEELLKKSYSICPGCGYYFPLSAWERINLICDQGSFKELYVGIKSKDPLQFPEYEQKLEQNRQKTGLSDAFIAGTGRIGGGKAAVGVLDSHFMMGSMGTVVGEKLARLAEHAARHKEPLVIFSASGGARMQEGLYSLMQMAKTTAAVERFRQEGGLFISVLTNPTTGGVSASYASLGDVILAEPDALICFAGPRVIEQTIGQKLPEGFQHAEFLLEHGMIDRIVPREEMKEMLSLLLELHGYGA